MNFGLIGKNISYSFSESYFTQKFHDLGIDANYHTFDLNSIEELPKLIKSNDLEGFNVTIPFKEEVLQFIDDLDKTAREIGAVNCVKIERGKCIGYNTDAFGFEGSLLPMLTPQDRNAIIFGDGGAAKAIKYVLNKLGIDFLIVTRKGKLNFSNISLHHLKDCQILINTTPVGTFPNTDDVLPIPLEGIQKYHLVYDLIYNPEKTKLLQIAENKGARIKNGHEMLVLQAEKSWDIWNENQ